MKLETLKHKGYEGSIETSLEDQCLHGRILFIQDRVTYEGQTIPELDQCFREAVDDYLETCEEIGKSPEKPCSGQFQVRVSPETHRDAIRFAYQANSSLNEFVKTAIEEKVSQQYTVRHVHEHRLTVTFPEQEFSIDTYRDLDQWVPSESMPISH